jgi:hypothetical protein
MNLTVPGQLVAMAMQQMHRLHQHRGVRVVAAGMHAAGNLAGEIEPGLLRHRQCVHVAAQEDRAAALRARFGAGQRYDEARGRLAARNLDIQTLQAVEHRLRRQRQIEPELGLRVNAPAQRDRRGQKLFRLVEKCRQLGHAILRVTARRKRRLGYSNAEP